MDQGLLFSWFFIDFKEDRRWRMVVIIWYFKDKEQQKQALH